MSEFLRLIQMNQPQDTSAMILNLEFRIDFNMIGSLEWSIF